MPAGIRNGLHLQMPPVEEPPLRAELFSADQMELHGKNLAAMHKLAAQRAPDQLLRRLTANAVTLSSVCKLLTEAVTAKRRITPAGEWLLDNFYLIEDQIRTARRHLPKGYSRELPRLARGPSAMQPRVYDIALEAIAHGDGRVDAESLSRFVAAYQTVTPLRLGELWAIPIMLRLALIENLRRVAVRVAEGRLDRNLADNWADQMMAMAEGDPKSLVLVVADMARSGPPMTTPFVSELVRRLQGQSSALALPLTWIEQQLAESSLTIEQLVQAGNQQQAADQVTVSNSIGSLRFLGEMDWREFVETMSVADQALRKDPAGIYVEMDFATRDRYRHVIERIAKGSELTEAGVAELAVQMAWESAHRKVGEAGLGERSSHVGYYLVDKGLTALEQAASLHSSRLEALHRKAGQSPLSLYLGAIALLSLVFSGGLLYRAYAGGAEEWLLALTGVAVLLATSQFAVGMVNWLATLLVQPHPLPRMDYSKGIAAQSRTLVVVPTMLTSAQSIDDLVEALEVRFLGNRDEQLYFGLLTDLRDGPQETMPEDAALMEQAAIRIAALNEKYADESADLDTSAPAHAATKFFLLHRPRRWNPHERVWMGHERKRGKLGDLNALLRGDVAVEGKNRFSLIVGDTSLLHDVKYVITLDTDTQLPRDAGRKFIATMAHPLNRPGFASTDCADSGKVGPERVAEGYGILQPRVAVSLPGTNRSRYAQLFGGDPGIDPYTRTVSDVYQDVFGEGSFIGKGIYDVDAFERALCGRFPDNRILSHDLIEGCYARSGLLSDVELYETYPSRYSADVSRRHRWIRGDWQLLPQLLGGGQTAQARRNAANGTAKLTALSRWKLFDNLRRSLVPTALTLMLVLGWTVLPAAWLWTLSVLAILVIAPLSALVLDTLRKPPEMLLRQHFIAMLDAAGRSLSHAAFTLVCLPYEALFSLDAIVRTLWRLAVSRRRLLEWNPSGEHAAGADSSERMRAMWFGPALALSLLVYLVVMSPAVLVHAMPILLLWLVSPAIAWWLSRTLEARQVHLLPEQLIFLRNLARRTWAFFDRFVGAEDNWLPPDNYQEHPVATIAHRTSPTNIGMALLANLSAYDFGYIAAGELLERTANTFQTLAGLERYQGHFYNWYDTQSLQPLHPIYISTVDSGNLAGHLMTLRPGLLALADAPILHGKSYEGLDDTLRVLVDACAGLPVEAQSLLLEFQRDLEKVVDARYTSLAAAHVCLERLVAVASALLAFTEHDPVSDADIWAQALVRQCCNARDELIFLAPWLLLPVAPPGCELPGNADSIPTLRDLALLDGSLLLTVAPPQDSATQDAVTTAQAHDWMVELQRLTGEASTRAQERLATIERLASHAGELSKMEYGFLYDEARHLLAIGYNLDERRRDTSCYDLLASEARLCSFVAIAQGKIPQENWFALGRLLASGSGDPILMSWSGSMFEYLMPLLVMPTFDNTLLDQTNLAAVRRQIEYGKQRSVPWGISESGYNTVDAQFNYQYRAFGVPGLGLKRGLAEDLVVAPYASVMALMVTPEDACSNLQGLATDGMLGTYGFYEAVDFTPARQRRGETRAIVRSFMAHHQGMSLLSLNYLLQGRPMQRRFETDPLFQATMLLLHERIPKATSFHAQDVDLSGVHDTANDSEMPIRVFKVADTPVPEVQLLSNGRYHVMVTNAGGGYSRWKDLDLTRWREDTTCDNWGTFCYIRDLSSNTFWSSSHQPTRKNAERFEAIFSEGRAEFRRRDVAGVGSDKGSFDTHTEIVVSPEDDIELRRVRITNRSATRRSIDVTSYAEVVLAPAAADAAHPAFSNLFVQTEIVAARRAILCTRRPRSQGEAVPWMLHLMTVHGASVGKVSYETDRMRFIGRGQTVASPQAMTEATTLSGTQGSVLDPVVAIRYNIILEPEQTATIDIVTGATDTREAALSLVDKYHDRRLADRVFELAWTHSQVVLRQINATEADAQLYGRLASSVLYANAMLRADPSIILRNRRGQSGLWGYAISGDLPIVLVQIANPDNIDLVRQLVQARAYWRLKGLVVDLVIWNEDHAGYRQQLQEQISGLISAGIEANVIDKPGGIFVRPGEQISHEDRILLQSVARVILADTRGSLAEQLARSNVEGRVPRLVPTRPHSRESLSEAALPIRHLDFFNGIGGFSPDGREYVIAPDVGKMTPAPWSNVLANPDFGTVISESGMAYTWGENAHEYRLTPWQNDPVSDGGGEAFYLRDEESGYYWSPTPLPCRGETPYVSRHGFGYSVFEHVESGIQSELTVYVALDASVKFSVLKVRNESGRTRKLSATGYVEWVLGDLRSKTTMQVTTEVDASSGALFARNHYSNEFADRVAFFDADEGARTVTCDRTSFIGRNGSLRTPSAMRRMRLSGKTGAALDPCAAIQIPFDLADGQEREIVFRLGVGRDTDMGNIDSVHRLVARFKGTMAARSALDAVRDYWRHTLGAVQVETPDPALDVITNGWLMYQTMACRLWARSGYYQSGGAFGFRDQLQDTMALIHAEPRLMREQVLLCASRQFHEGDVQHWWHPPAGRGVRTHCSDDYLWLPLAACRYVFSTGDSALLDESVHFLEGRPVNAEDDSYYDLPGRSADAASVYEHCVRAIEHGLRFGEHGLPLMGSGDWNDGMDRVGSHGKGESVWLGFFLCEVLTQFADLARQRGDLAFAARCLEEGGRLRRNIESNAWDGAWYRRAYFDDGTPLGSASNAECQIDSISQSWSVLSGMADETRSRMAMDEVYKRLVRRDDQLIQLLDPPFDKSDLYPGYIRGYVPGVRENGGQYTHAAIWTTMAFAALGDGQRAWELFGMINPVNHAASRKGMAAYKVEPYVVCADVYGVAPHTGRGGWSWYTGSAGWMYRLIVESLLGLRREGDRLSINPCMPDDWKTFSMRYRYGETSYHIAVLRAAAGVEAAMQLTVDGVLQKEAVVVMCDDKAEHGVEVILRLAAAST
ncbi:MAG: NdvB [Rhodocyclales bacterium]|nr:NdvB [Rhodocyclales bacterium]